MPATSRFLPAAAGGVVGAALCVGALAIGGVFAHDAPVTKITARQPAAASDGRVAPAPRDLNALYEKVGPSVVEIRARGIQSAAARATPFGAPQPPDPRGGGTATATGSGFVVGADGTIVTNAHVVAGAKTLTVRFEENQKPITAKLLGADRSTDIAVLKIDPQAATGGAVRPLRLAPAGAARVGDTVLAIGNPFGLEGTATAGIVSAVGRSIQAPNGFSIPGAIQTDAPINPGNSGGPLLDAQGRVLGVNSQILTGGAQGNVGIGFAVPSTTVMEVLPALKAGKAIDRPYLGVSTADRPNADGATVGAVVKGGPADAAGLRPRDVVVAVAGKAVTGPTDIGAAIAGRKPGATVKVAVLRGGKRTEVPVRLGTRPAAVR